MPGIDQAYSLHALESAAVSCLHSLGPLFSADNKLGNIAMHFPMPFPHVLLPLAA